MNKYEITIDKALKEYEDHKPYKQHELMWIIDRIEWCFKFRKIDYKSRMKFVNRVLSVQAMSQL